MTTLYIIRHGESAGNTENLFAGNTDVPLTETGEKQAQLLGVFLRNMKIDKMYSSDLQRAVATIRPAAELKGMDIVTDKRLREIYGGEWEMKPFASLAGLNPEEFYAWKHSGEAAVCPGGESVGEMADRVFDALEDIARENDGKTVAVSTHATPLKSFIARLKGIHLNDVDWAPNASVTTVTYENGKFEIKEIGRCDYLQGLITKLSPII